MMRAVPMPGVHADAGLNARIPTHTAEERRLAALRVTESAMRDGWVDDLRLVLEMLDLAETAS